MRTASARHVSAGLLALALMTAACNSPSRTIRPVIHARHEDEYQAMKSAPVIVLAEITSAELVSRERTVEKPKEVGGPNTQTIPLYLARMSAKVLLTLRGAERSTMEFYCWVWASGTHGGPRLFYPGPGSTHILFLREEAGYLHTVGDYPAYDLEVRSAWLPTFVEEWKANRESLEGPFERIVVARLRAELKVTSDILPDFWLRDRTELMGLTSPFFLASHLDSYCRHFENPFGRFASCAFTAQAFEGRCTAYRLAMQADSNGTKSSVMSERLERCVSHTKDTASRLRAENWPSYLSGTDRRETAERRRLTMRFYASAMDPEVQRAACEAAANMPEARDIPECSALKHNGRPVLGQTR